AMRARARTARSASATMALAAALIAPSALYMPCAIALPMLAPTARAVAAADPPMPEMMPGMRESWELTALAASEAPRRMALAIAVAWSLDVCAMLVKCSALVAFIVAICSSAAVFMPSVWKATSRLIGVGSEGALGVI